MLRWQGELKTSSGGARVSHRRRNATSDSGDVARTACAGPPASKEMSWNCLSFRSQHWRKEGGSAILKKLILISGVSFKYCRNALLQASFGHTLGQLVNWCSLPGRLRLRHTKDPVVLLSDRARTQFSSRKGACI